MKFILLSLLFVFLSQSIFAQITPIYSKYLQNQFILNPALSGNKDHVDLYGIFQRGQFSNTGTTQTLMLTANGANKNGKIGFGGGFFMDRFSLEEESYRDLSLQFDNIGGNFSMAYHHDFKNSHRLSFGTSLAFQKTRFDLTRYDDYEQWNYTLEQGARFDVNIGVNYSFKGLNIGFSIPHLTHFELESSTFEYRLQRAYFANISYEFSIAKDRIFLEPGIQLNMKKGNYQQVNVYSQISYKRMVWLTAMYSYDRFMLLGAGVQLHDIISLNFLGNLMINESITESGRFEVMLGIRIGKRDNTGLIENFKN